MSYRSKFTRELLWFLVVAVVIVLAQQLLTFDGTAITDWRAWAVGFGSAAVRGLASGAAMWFGKEILLQDGSGEAR